MDRTHPCGGCDVGSIPAESTEEGTDEVPRAQCGNTARAGNEKFCGDPFSRMGSKTRPEKFSDATASENVLGRFCQGHQSSTQESVLYQNILSSY